MKSLDYITKFGCALLLLFAAAETVHYVSDIIPSDVIEHAHVDHEHHEVETGEETVENVTILSFTGVFLNQDDVGNNRFSAYLPGSKVHSVQTPPPDSIV